MESAWIEVIGASIGGIVGGMVSIGLKRTEQGLFLKAINPTSDGGGRVVRYQVKLGF